MPKLAVERVDKLGRGTLINDGGRTEIAPRRRATVVSRGRLVVNVFFNPNQLSY